MNLELTSFNDNGVLRGYVLQNEKIKNSHNQFANPVEMCVGVHRDILINVIQNGGLCLVQKLHPRRDIIIFKKQELTELAIGLQN